MKSKASGNTLAALQEFIAEMRLIAGAASKVLIRTHTDDGKEFIGELKYEDNDAWQAFLETDPWRCSISHHLSAILP